MHCQSCRPLSASVGLSACRPVGLSELSERRMTVTTHGACQEALSGCRDLLSDYCRAVGLCRALSEVTVGLSDRGSVFGRKRVGRSGNLVDRPGFCRFWGRSVGFCDPNSPKKGNFACRAARGRGRSVGPPRAETALGRARQSVGG